VSVTDIPPCVGGKPLASAVTAVLPDAVVTLLADFLSSLCTAAACEEPDGAYINLQALIIILAKCK